MKTIFTIGMEGGLGNRMRVAAAAASIAPKIQGQVDVIWTPQWGMGCRFDQLFIPYANDNLSLRDATLHERIFAARPRPRNLFLSRLTNHIRYRSVIYNEQVSELCGKGFDFAAWANTGPTLLWTWYDFEPWKPELLAHLFKPLPEIVKLIDQRTKDFTEHTIGLHIRRTDNKESIQSSPTSLFTDVIDRRKEVHDDLRIYLATDDETTKHELQSRYGKCIITSAKEARRDSVDGIREGLVEMLALSRTSHIYGSAGSSFSVIAAKYGNTPLTILQRNTQVI